MAKKKNHSLSSTVMRFIEDMHLSEEEKEIQVDMAKYMINTLYFSEEQTKRWIEGDVKVELKSKAVGMF
jgi:hypothetical protein